MQDKKRRILKAAVKVFAEKGFNGATVKEIAQEAGVAEGTIFNYFDTKKDVLIELTAPAIVDSLAKLIVEVRVEGDDIEKILTKFIKSRITNIVENVELFKILFYELQFHQDLKETVLSELILKGNELMEILLKEKMKQGEFKEFDPKIAMKALIGMFSIFIFWKEIFKAEHIENYCYSYDKIVGQIIEIFLYGIAND